MSDYNLTSLARALSQPQMDLSDASSDGFPARLSMQPSRRRKLSSCNSLESVEQQQQQQQLASPSAAEARVLVINTGGTIGMTLHDNGNAMHDRCDESKWGGVWGHGPAASLVDLVRLQGT